MTKKYICQNCNYETDIHCNYQKHLQTRKHLKNDQKPSTQNRVMGHPKMGDGSPNFGCENGFICQYCQKSYRYKNHRARHLNRCKMKKMAVSDGLMNELQIENMLIKKEKEEIHKEKEEIQKQKDELAKQNEKLIKEFNKCLLDIWNERTANQTVNIQQNNINNINVNNLSIRDVKRLFKNAKNYEDLMAPPLSGNEIDSIETSPISGCIDLVKSRCLDGKTIDQWPLHMVDKSRNKLVVRHKNNWVVDYGQLVLQQIDLKLSQLTQTYNLEEYDEREMQIKIISTILKDRSKIINYLSDDILLQNNKSLIEKL